MTGMRLAFMVSGNGTLFESVATRCLSGELAAKPVILISSNPDAPAIERARRLNIPWAVLQRKDFAHGEEFTSALLAELSNHHADLICLAGYMKLVPEEVVRQFRHRMLNIHPALLPAFGGKGMYGEHVHNAVIAYGARISGVTVHLVDEEYDHGPIVLQRAVFVRQDDTPQTLAERIHGVEYDLYADAVRLFVDDRIRIENRKVIILPKKLP